MQQSGVAPDRRRSPSRRDRGMTALIEGFFGFMWFGWGRADASSGLSVVLAVGAVLAVAVAGVGAAALGAAGQSDFIPAWVCAVVGVHMFPLASLLGDRLLVPLGTLLAAVAVVAAGAGLAGWVPPSTVTGLGAGVLLTLFGAVALAGRR
jgi:hypothetical protein